MGKLTEETMKAIGQICPSLVATSSKAGNAKIVKNAAKLVGKSEDAVNIIEKVRDLGKIGE
jgi:hypothetical protein